MIPPLRIAHLYPLTMFGGGDRGNVFALQKRARFHSLPIHIESIEIGQGIQQGYYDLFIMGGGEEAAQKAVCADLLGKKGDILMQEIEKGIPCLAIAAAFELFGKHFTDSSGKKCPALEYLDMYSEREVPAIAGTCLIEVTIDGKSEKVVGFEQHFGRNYLGPNTRPLGRVLMGKGNNGQDGNEGVAHKGFIGTYLHGPLLALNVALCDVLLLPYAATHFPDVVHKKDTWYRPANVFEKAAYEEARARASS